MHSPLNLPSHLVFCGTVLNGNVALSFVVFWTKKWYPSFIRKVLVLQKTCFKVKDTINPSQLFIFTNNIRCSRLPLWVGCFIYFKFLHVSFHIFSSIKETNWLMNKRMCVLLFDVFKHLLLRKTEVLKTYLKSKLLGKKIWRNALALKSKTVQGIFEKTFIMALLSSQLSFVYKTMSQIYYKLFRFGDIRLLSEFLRKRGWFQGQNERFPKYLAKY